MIMSGAKVPQDQYTQVGQILTRYWVMGDRGPPVILIHGLGASVEHWLHNIRALAAAHRVYAIDLVGSGLADKPEAAYSLEQFARFVNAFMVIRDVHCASLVGHSIGGAVALTCAVQFPEKVDKLVLVSSNPPGKSTSLQFRLATLPFIGEWLTRPSRERVARSLRNRFHDPELIGEELIDIEHHMAGLPGAPEARLSTVRALGSFCGLRHDIVRPIRDNLHAISAPTLIIWGRQDRILPVAHAHAARERIPSARLRVLDSCGHLPQLECPEAFNALVSEFLAS
jgi:4,5:9,10-diseco-3-hydroxy-5,9,17-trioxoandrosta-1(10),2-diene-4-oate hydrolase